MRNGLWASALVQWAATTVLHPSVITDITVIILTLAHLTDTTVLTTS
jgi:hypothetical protein